MLTSELVALVSGENPVLAFGELRSLLLAQNQPICGMKLEFERLVQFPVVGNSKSIQELASWLVCRAALTHHVGLILGLRRDTIETADGVNLTEVILDSAESINDELWPSSTQTFAVRFRRIGEAMADGKYRKLLPILERELGSLIRSKTGPTVALDNPQCRIDGFLTSTGVVLSKRLATANRTAIRERRPSKRAFFHPSAMGTILARCIVNLALPKEGDILVDPFAGSGGFLIEADEMNLQVIGIEKNRGQLWGLKKNLRAHGHGLAGGILGDARYPPFRPGAVACIATDPPYGIASSTEGVVIETLLENMLKNWKPIVRGRLVICLPRTIPIVEIAKRVGWYPIEIYYWLVHRSLTRQITVFVQDSSALLEATPTWESPDPKGRQFAPMREQRKGDP
ncbi:MAG: DNA methyltransferase [Candidatus Heimdallarchaeota archaeon]